MNMIYGYARVSTKGQATDGNSLEAQRKLLKENGAEVIFEDSFTGTKTDRPEFKRLLDIIEDAIENNIIKEEVVVQAGSTKYDSKNMKIFDVIPMNEFDKLMKKCDILITHGGVGSIITGLKNNKKIRPYGLL